jgi:Tfp pilus assembly protein PilN
MSQETEIALLTHKVEHIHSDMGEMKKVMSDVANALTRLTIIDERQSQMMETQGRIFKILDKLDARVDVLEKSEGKQNQAATWVFGAVWGAAGLLVMYVAKMLGLV